MSDNINVLLKLFDTLKESSDRNEEATQKLVVQQLDLVGHIKHLPIEDLRLALKEHAKESTDSVTTTRDDVMSEIKIVSNKVSKMILAVVVAFSILTGGYVIIRTAADNQETINISQEEQHRKVARDVIEEIRKEMRDLHNEEKGH